MITLSQSPLIIQFLTQMRAEMVATFVTGCNLPAFYVNVVHIDNIYKYNIRGDPRISFITSRNQ